MLRTIPISLLMLSPASAQIMQDIVNSQVVIVKNIVKDFGATCNGTGNDNVAFTAFNAWALNWQTTNNGLIELYIPSGSVCMFSGGGIGNYIVKGIKNVLVSGYGAAFSDNNGAGNGWFLGGIGTLNTPDAYQTGSARMATVAAGATSLQLLTLSDAAKFTAGNWAVMTGLDMQGSGYPQNPRFFEHVFITAINASTGVITLASPLKFSYESTWPLYDAGSFARQPDQGGPATLFVMDPSWNAQIEYDGLTFESPYQSFGAARSITFKDDAFTGTQCLLPTEDGSFVAINVNWSTCNIEIDKQNDFVYIANSSINGVYFQSASVTNAVINNTAILENMNGSPINLTMNNVTLPIFLPGPTGYGTDVSVSCTNCIINSILPGGIVASLSGFTMSNGVLSTPLNNGPVAWAVPGSTVFFTSPSYDFELPFTVVDVSTDGTNTLIQTNCGGGFPPIFGTATRIRTGPAPVFTCTNCTGSADAIDLSGAPPAIPIWSYSRRTYTGNNAPGTETVPVSGLLENIAIDVSTVYTGPTSGLAWSTAYPFSFILVGGARNQFHPTINPTIAGTRTITPTAVTGSQTNDSITAPGLGTWWLDNQLSPQFSTDISGQPSTEWPVITMTITTNQTPQTTPGTTPTGLTATPVSSSQINLSWTASTDSYLITGYEVFRNGVQVGTPSGTTYNDTGLASSTSYTYTVKSVNMSGLVSPASTAVIGTTQS